MRIAVNQASKFAALLLILPSLSHAANTPCAIADLQAKAPKDTTILAARVVPAKDKIPEHCFVEGNVATPGPWVPV